MADTVWFLHNPTIIMVKCHNANLWKFKTADDRYFETRHIVIFQWNIIWLWWEFVCCCTLDYNGTCINKTQNFEIRYDWMDAMSEDTFFGCDSTKVGPIYVKLFLHYDAVTVECQKFWILLTKDGETLRTQMLYNLSGRGLIVSAQRGDTVVLTEWSLLKPSCSRFSRIGRTHTKPMVHINDLSCVLYTPVKRVQSMTSCGYLMSSMTSIIDTLYALSYTLRIGHEPLNRLFSIKVADTQTDRHTNRQTRRLANNNKGRLNRSSARTNMNVNSKDLSLLDNLLHNSSF